MRAISTRTPSDLSGCFGLHPEVDPSATGPCETDDAIRPRSREAAWRTPTWRWSCTRSKFARLHPRSESRTPRERSQTQSRPPSSSCCAGSTSRPSTSRLPLTVRKAGLLGLDRARQRLATSAT